MYKIPREVFIPRMAEVCKECGCSCHSCNSNSLDLHHEIEELRSKLVQSNNHILQMERDFVQSRDYAEQEIAKLQDELGKLRDRYDRLYESHKKLQRVNHNLEDKLLTIVNNYETEKTALQKDVASLTSKLIDSKVTIGEIEEENERFRNDCNIAVQLLQCKPSNFVAHKLNTLPLDLQERVKSHMTRDEIIELEDASNPVPETKMIRVPMPTFPPTAMVYSVNKVPGSVHSSNQNQTGSSVTANDNNKLETVPTNVIASVLAHPEQHRKPRKLYLCTNCKSDFSFMDKNTQTAVTFNNKDSNGVSSPTSMSPPGYRTNISASRAFATHPGVHRPRLNSTETEI